MRAKNPRKARGLFRRTQYRCFRFLVRLLVRPVVVGTPPQNLDHGVYVLYTRSLSDLTVLDLVTSKLNIESPMDPVAGFDESKRFFFLRRSTGIKFKHTTYHQSRRMLRLHAQLLKNPESVVNLVPVSIYWGRANAKENSILRGLVADDWAISAKIRRAICMFLARRDIFVHFGDAFEWRQPAVKTPSPQQFVRFMLRSMRTHFKNERFKALGPIVPDPRQEIRRLSKRSVEPNDATKTPSLSQSSHIRKVLKTMVARPTYPAYVLIRLVLRYFWRKVFDGVTISAMHRIADHAGTHTLIYVPNHRSHIDYLALSYFLYENGFAVPNIASGENLNLFLVGGILKRCGAFFIRRSFKEDPVYRGVFATYVHDVLSRGQSMEFFIEGTRSRSGRMLRPQHGLLDVARSLPLGPDARPLTVVPVFFSYEALVEGDAYIRQLSGESKKRESFLSALQTIRFLQLYLGSVRFRFGPPLTISPPDERIAEQSTAELSEKITARINDSAVFNPIHLCALAITDSHPGLIHESEIEDRIEFCKTLLRIDVHQHDYEIVSDTAEHCLSRAVSLGYFTREHDALFVDESNIQELGWFRNNVLHAFVVPAVLASKILAINQDENGTFNQTELRYLIAAVCFLYSVEFSSSDTERWLVNLSNAQLIQRQDDNVWIVNFENADALRRLQFLAGLIEPTIQCILIVLQSIENTTLEGTQLDEIVECVEREYTSHNQEILLSHRIFFDNDFIESVLESLVRHRVVQIDDSGVQLIQPSFSALTQITEKCLSRSE